jgi:hypothetical protein
VGFTIGQGFVVGYGIDYAEQYRGLRNIRVLVSDDRDDGARRSASGGFEPLDVPAHAPRPQERQSVRGDHLVPGRRRDRLPCDRQRLAAVGA